METTVKRIRVEKDVYGGSLLDYTYTFYDGEDQILYAKHCTVFNRFEIDRNLTLDRVADLKNYVKELFKGVEISFSRTIIID